MGRGLALAAVAAPLAVAVAGACGGDEPLAWDGLAGRPIPAGFDQWVPDALAAVDGSSHHLLIDTGAPLTLLDTDSIGLATGAHEVDLALGDLTFPDLPVLAFDVVTYGQTRRPPLEGILGGDVLTSFALSLDYQGGQIWLEEAAGPLPDGAEPSALAAPLEIPAEVAGGGVFTAPDGTRREVGATRFLVRASAEDLGPGQSFWALVDTGASAVVLSSQLVDILGDEGRPRLDGVTVGTATGVVSAYYTRLWSLRLEGAAAGDDGADLASVPVLVLDEDDLFDAASAEVGAPVLAILGGTYLRWFLTTMDFPRRSMTLRPYLAPDHIDPAEFAGVGFTMARSAGQWRVDRVIPGTDAEDEGLASGDPVLALDGTPTATLDAAEVDAILAAPALGEELPVAIERAGEMVEILVSVEDLLPEFEAPR